MLISHSHKFIFIHVYKVAGSSIGDALREFAHFPSKVNKAKSFLGLAPKIFCNDFPGHIKANELKEKIPAKIFDNYFKFAFVRNPWDWQVSLYHFALQTPRHHQHKLIKNMQSFDEYIEWRVAKDLRLQKEFLYDNEKLLVDVVGKMESIESDFLEICQKVGLPPIHLPKKNPSKHKHYTEYYTEHTRQLVAEAFEEDINTFRYEF